MQYMLICNNICVQKILPYDVFDLVVFKINFYMGVYNNIKRIFLSLFFSKQEVSLDTTT